MLASEQLYSVPGHQHLAWWSDSRYMKPDTIVSYLYHLSCFCWITTLCNRVVIKAHGECCCPGNYFVPVYHLLAWWLYPRRINQILSLYIYIYTYIYIYIYMYVCMYIYMYIYMCVYVCVYVYIYVCVCVYMYMCMYVCVCVYVCVCIYMYIISLLNYMWNRVVVDAHGGCCCPGNYFVPVYQHLAWWLYPRHINQILSFYIDIYVISLLNYNPVENSRGWGTWWM